MKPEKMYSEAREHDDRFLLPRRFGRGDQDTDMLYSAAERLVDAGCAFWLPPASNFWPGIRLTAKELPDHLREG